MAESEFTVVGSKVIEHDWKDAVSSMMKLSPPVADVSDPIVPINYDVYIAGLGLFMLETVNVALYTIL